MFRNLYFLGQNLVDSQIILLFFTNLINSQNCLYFLLNFIKQRLN